MISKKQFDRFFFTTALMAVFLVVGAFGLGTYLSGCAARVGHVTDLPQGVTEQQAKNYDAEIANLHKIADVTTTLRRAVISVRGAGAFPDDAAYGKLLLMIGKLDQAQLAATAYLRGAPEYFGETQKQKIKDIFSDVTAEIQQLNASGVTGIKNPDSLKQINTLIGELAGFVNLVLSLT